MILLLTFIACHHPTPPPVFGMPIPEPVPAERVDIPDPDPLDWSYTVVHVGDPMPYQVDGVATHRGVMMPLGELAACSDSMAMEDHWSALYTVSKHGRDDDRRHCEDIAGGRWVYGHELEQHLAWTRAAVPVAGVVGLFVGAAVVGAALELTR